MAPVITGFKTTISMCRRPLVVNFSGNDSSGLAGLAADIRTQQAMGVHSAAVVTANTAQNNYGVSAINAVDHQVFISQLQAIESLPYKAVKIGLIASLQQVLTIRDFLDK
ncbi:MAG: hydroxymethylpyrimidine kinase/phosphomethylpyrimidine kinase/thiamine-phosphate diphosphorylase, partial [Cellvibrionaceae bacterium]